MGCVFARETDSDAIGRSLPEAQEDRSPLGAVVEVAALPLSLSSRTSAELLSPFVHTLWVLRWGILYLGAQSQEAWRVREEVCELKGANEQQSLLSLSRRCQARDLRRERDYYRSLLLQLCPELRRLPTSPVRALRIQRPLREALDQVGAYNSRTGVAIIPPTRSEIVDTLWNVFVLFVRRRAYRQAVRVAEGNRRRWRRLGWHVRPSPFLNERELFERTTLEISRRYLHSQQLRRAENRSQTLRALDVTISAAAA